MTELQLENKLIAEHIGMRYDHFPKEENDGWYVWHDFEDTPVKLSMHNKSIYDLEFHNDWSQLHIAISIIHFSIVNKIYKIDYQLFEEQSVCKLFQLLIYCDISTAYEEALNFVKWYNTNKFL